MIHMGVDLNSFIWDPSFLAKNILAKLSPSVCCIFVCHLYCMMDIMFLVNGFFCTGRYEKKSLFVSKCLLLGPACVDGRGVLWAFA